MSARVILDTRDSVHTAQWSKKHKHVRHESGSSPGIAHEDFTRIAAANAAWKHLDHLVAVGIWLEGAFNFHADVVGLLL